MSKFDNWLAQQVENNEPCTPKVVRIAREPEGPAGDFSETKIYNCEECDNKECEEWKDFHDSDE